VVAATDAALLDAVTDGIVDTHVPHERLPTPAAACMMQR
jgi:hypothetical protein